LGFTSRSQDILSFGFQEKFIAGLTAIKSYLKEFKDFELIYFFKHKLKNALNFSNYFGEMFLSSF